MIEITCTRCSSFTALFTCTRCSSLTALFTCTRCPSLTALSSLLFSSRAAVLCCSAVIFVCVLRLIAAPRCAVFFDLFISMITCSAAQVTQFYGTECRFSVLNHLKKYITFCNKLFKCCYVIGFIYHVPHIVCLRILVLNFLDSRNLALRLVFLPS